MKTHMLNFKAIFIGWLIDNTLSILVGVILVMVFCARSYLSGELIEENQEKIIESFLSSPFILISLIIGLILTALGGYMTAKIAESRKIIHSFIMGTLSFIFSEMSMVSIKRILPSWYIWSSYLLVIPAAILGALIYIGLPDLKTK